MNKPTFTFLAILSILFFTQSTALAQTNILVQPYLQDAEPTSIKVLWETNGGATHKLQWGTTAANLNQSAPVSSSTSSGSNEIHTSIITGLTANTKFFYQVNSDGTTSAVFDFKTPPTKSSNQSFNLVAMSDMQKDGSHPNKFSEVVNDGVIDYFEDHFGNDLPTDIGFVMIPGDLVPTGTSYNQWQNDFFAPSNPLFSHVPVYPVLGNHENNAGFYFDYFDLPNNGSTGYEEHWWYKDYSNVRIIGLNSNSGYRIQTQLDWLEMTLDDACADADIDFVFAQLHHPHLSELWTPGELGYTGDVIALLENFTRDCEKPSVHFFGHTHGYSRGQSKGDEHLWVNVASAGGAIDNWGEFPNADYEEFNKSIDEYGFVVVNVEAGADPKFTLRRITRGDQDVTIDNEEQDVITLKKTDTPPQKPVAVFPNNMEVNPDCAMLTGSAFSDASDFHQASQWQVATSCGDFSNPIIDSWKQHENWYNEVDTQAGDDLTDEEIGGLEPQSTYCWRVRYRDEHLKWSEWSDPTTFTTGDSELTANLLSNEGAENGINNWTTTTGIIESLGAGECNGISPRTGAKYFAVGGLCDGNETNFSEVFQNIDVSSMSTEIDGGDVSVLLGGYLSNFNGSDQPTMQLEYLNNVDVLLGSSSVLTSLASSWTKVEANEAVPENTRTIKVILTGTRNGGTDNDSYFDDLFVQLDMTPGEGSCSDVPLPVELISFKGECANDHANLNWEVADEIDLRHYQIAKSLDLKKWMVVGSELPGTSTSSRKTYSHTSWEKIKGQTVYFRLEIVDLDGTINYSPVVKVSCVEERSVQVFPNPITQDEFTISLKQMLNEEVTILVTDILGRRVLEERRSLKRGDQEVLVSAGDWAAGVYSIGVFGDGWEWSEILVRE
ncbi:MAG: fibronectin type III domain-containing protein [Saprospiraceae bacterium]